eukprot:600777-Rhodomonas_salina.2
MGWEACDRSRGAACSQPQRSLCAGEPRGLGSSSDSGPEPRPGGLGTRIATRHGDSLGRPDCNATAQPGASPSESRLARAAVGSQPWTSRELVRPGLVSRDDVQTRSVRESRLLQR